MQNLNTQNEISLSNHHVSGLASLFNNLFKLAIPCIEKLNADQMDKLLNDCELANYIFSEANANAQLARYEMDNANEKWLVQAHEVSASFSEAQNEIAYIATYIASEQKQQLKDEINRLQIQLNTKIIKDGMKLMRTTA